MHSIRVDGMGSARLLPAWMPIVGMLIDNTINCWQRVKCANKVNTVSSGYLELRHTLMG